MISIEQWRASVGSFSSKKFKQTSTQDVNFELPEKDVFSDDNRWKVSRKAVILAFMCPLVTFSLVFGGQNYPAVIESLLIRSGIEQNPGPTSPAEVVGFLIVNAPNDDVKKTLNKYSTEKDHTENTKSLNKPSIKLDDLKKTLVYLENRSDDSGLCDILKEGLVELIVKRVEHLLPDTCDTCGKGYAISIHEEPRIKCIICSKGCCQACTTTYGDNLTNVGLKNVFWFCASCNQAQHAENSDRQNKLLKASVKTKKQTEPMNTLSTEIVEVNDDVEIVDDSTENKAPNKRTLAENPKPSKKDIMCKFFKENRCKFGATGKGCNYKHTKMCYRFVKHGYDKKLGCAGCDKFHPTLCKGSKTTKKCFMENCRAYHLKGTQRVKDKPQTNRPPKQLTNQEDQNKAIANDASFLELKKEIATIHQLLKVMGNGGWSHGAQGILPAASQAHHAQTHPLMLHPTHPHFLVTPPQKL